MRRVRVELGGDPDDLRQTGPGDVRDVVVSLVQPNLCERASQVTIHQAARRTRTRVVAEQVERPVVGPRLLVPALEQVVLGNLRESSSARAFGDDGATGRAYKVARTGVQAAGHVAAEQEVEHRVPAEGLDDDEVERELHEHVEGDPARRGLVPDKARPQGVKEDLKGAAEGRDTG